MTKEEFKSHVLPSKGKLFRLAVTMQNSRQEAEDTTYVSYYPEEDIIIAILSNSTKGRDRAEQLEKY